MTTKSKRHGHDASASESLVDAQQKMLRSKDAPRGYMGRGTPEEQDAEAERYHKVLNPPEGEERPRRGLRPPMLGRDPEADVEGLEGGAASGNLASRVGFIPVQHPRARTASALHDALGEADSGDLTVDELEALAERVGLTVEGTGANDAVLKADFVRAMDDIRVEYPRAKS
jgi:hypothetical protein